MAAVSPLTAPSVSAPPNVLPATAATLALCTSIRSTSLKAIVPLSLRFGVALSSVTAPIASVKPAVIVGASLVPVMVIVTTCVSVRACAELSVAFKVYLSTKVCPWARKLNAPSPLLPEVKVQLKFELGPGSAASAPAGTAIIALSAALLSGLVPVNVLEPSTARLTTDNVTVFAASTSTTFSAPVAVRVVLVSVVPALVAVPKMFGAW